MGEKISASKVVDGGFFPEFIIVGDSLYKNTTEKQVSVGDMFVPVSIEDLTSGRAYEIGYIDHDGDPVITDDEGKEYLSDESEGVYYKKFVSIGMYVEGESHTGHNRTAYLVTGFDVSCRVIAISTQENVAETIYFCPEKVTSAVESLPDKEMKCEVGGIVKINDLYYKRVQRAPEIDDLLFFAGNGEPLDIVKNKPYPVRHVDVFNSPFILDEQQREVDASIYEYSLFELVNKSIFTDFSKQVLKETITKLQETLSAL